MERASVDDYLGEEDLSHSADRRKRALSFLVDNFFVPDPD